MFFLQVRSGAFYLTAVFDSVVECYEFFHRQFVNAETRRYHWQFGRVWIEG